MILEMTVSAMLVVITVTMFYEVLRLTSNHLSDLPIPPRARIIVVVLAAFGGHTATVWIYTRAYWLLAVWWEIPSFGGGRKKASTIRSTTRSVPDLGRREFHHRRADAGGREQLGTVRDQPGRTASARSVVTTVSICRIPSRAFASN